jgi:hypothetical protein
LSKVKYPSHREALRRRDRNRLAGVVLDPGRGSLVSWADGVLPGQVVPASGLVACCWGRWCWPRGLQPMVSAGLAPWRSARAVH